MNRGGRLRRLVVTVALAALAGCTGTADPQTTAEYVPRVDPYFPEYGDDRYDVAHYDLAVTYDPASKELSGTMTATATANVATRQVSFDLVGLDVTEASVDGVAARVAHDGDKLVVTPATPLAAGDEFTVTVTYAGTPEPFTSQSLGSEGFHPTADGAFALGQPRSASSWFPVNDHPRDKATYRFEITVPEGLVAVSNGLPDGRDTSRGWTTWRWSEPVPTASYLTFVAIGDYRLYEQDHQGAPLVVAVHDDLPRGVDDQLLRSGEIADLLTEWFGPYPAQAYGGVALSDQRIRYALETQSRPVYGPAFFSRGQDATWVIVHELAHQWYGNSVSVQGWNDLWLNEGFATYAEWLWSEYHGDDTASELFDLYWDGPGAEPQFWTVPTGDPVGILVQPRGVRAGGDDATRPAAHRRRRHLLPDRAHVGVGEALQQRQHPGVHRPL